MNNQVDYNTLLALLNKNKEEFVDSITLLLKNLSHYRDCVEYILNLSMAKSIVLGQSIATMNCVIKDYTFLTCVSVIMSLNSLAKNLMDGNVNLETVKMWSDKVSNDEMSIHIMELVNKERYSRMYTTTVFR